MSQPHRPSYAYSPSICGTGFGQTECSDPACSNAPRAAGPGAGSAHVGTPSRCLAIRRVNGITARIFSSNTLQAALLPSPSVRFPPLTACPARGCRLRLSLRLPAAERAASRSQQPHHPPIFALVPETRELLLEHGRGPRLACRHGLCTYRPSTDPASRRIQVLSDLSHAAQQPTANRSAHASLTDRGFIVPSYGSNAVIIA